MAYEVPPLPYAFDALEPHIDAKTMEIHHDRHHAAYVNNANGALEKHQSWPRSRSRISCGGSAPCLRTSAPFCATTPADTRTTRSSGRSWALAAAAPRPDTSVTRSTAL